MSYLRATVSLKFMEDLYKLHTLQTHFEETEESVEKYSGQEYTQCWAQLIINFFSQRKTIFILSR